MGDGSLPTERAAAVPVPTLALAGGESFPFMRQAARTLAEAMPNARARTLEGQTHNVDPAALAPVLGEFFGGRT
jgi:pimeloyl-ACP methyl ester carboxylesterase